MRLFLILLAFASPAFAETGLYVWNDPQAKAIRLLTFDAKDPGIATAAHTLQKLTANSATMTAIDDHGSVVGLCRQERDDNEAPAFLSGYSPEGKLQWKHGASRYFSAMQALLPQGYSIGRSADWFTFECKDAGSSGEQNILAFDLGYSAGLPDAEGYVRSDDTEPFTARLYISGTSGAVLDAALVENRASRLKLSPNPTRQLYVNVAASVVYEISDPYLTPPKTGKGQMLWNNAPIRWQGKPAVKGFDFAWYLPAVRAE